MSSGILSLIEAAREKPLDFRVEMYCGQMVVAGQIAPQNWFYKVSANAFTEEVRAALRMRRKEPGDDWHARVDEVAEPFRDLMQVAEVLERDPVDEVTLINARIFPAVGSQGSQSGGRSIPVVRVPLSSIASWCLVSGATIEGKARTQIGWGFLFPIGN